jgi:voltage-gated potassium channel
MHDQSISVKEVGESHRSRTLRETIQFYMIDFQTPLGKAIDVFIIFLNLLVVALFVIDTYPISFGMRVFLWRIEVAAVGFFIIEYLLIHDLLHLLGLLLLC